jgi:hypothetical protein
VSRRFEHHAAFLGGGLEHDTDLVVAQSANDALDQPLVERAHEVAVLLGELVGGVGFGGFFIACAVFQIVWAVVVVGSPSPGVYRLGSVANGAMVAIWAISRTTGLPVGPDPWMPEPLGALDLLATGLEVVLIAVGAWALSATNADRGTAW